MPGNIEHLNINDSNALLKAIDNTRPKLVKVISRILTLSNGLPLAIVDMTHQISHQPVVTRERIREVYHVAGVGIAFISMMRFFAFRMR